MGNVDVSILDQAEKYKYKEQYESFKLIVNLIGMSLHFELYTLHFFWGEGGGSASFRRPGIWSARRIYVPS